MNTLVSETSPNVKVAVNETTVSAFGLTTAPVLETTAALLDAHVIVTSPTAVGKVIFLVTLLSESPSPNTKATCSNAASTVS